MSAVFALAGSPNCGKTALFNALTGGRQKVGNYAGVTVERKLGVLKSKSKQLVTIVDLPGTYSLDARTLDEQVTRDVLLGRIDEEAAPSVLIAVVDATCLERSLGLVLELKSLQIPMILAVNMIDLADARGLKLDCDALSRELELPVVATAAVQNLGVQALIDKALEVAAKQSRRDLHASRSRLLPESSAEAIRDRFKKVDQILSHAVTTAARPPRWTDRIDRLVLHPVWGTVLLFFVIAVMFQSIFSWASAPMDWIKNAFNHLGAQVGHTMSDGPLRSLIVDGMIVGVGAVVVFLPQILVLFAFILVLEDSGYMARAAFLMDRIMGSVGLNGRAFIPLLSSYACAIPGILSTRTIQNRRDRLITIMVAPLTTCSARLPVYALLIGTFIPARPLLGPLTLQGVTLLALYLAGIGAALLIALLFKKTILRGPTPELLMDLPTYKWPSFKNIWVGLIERSQLFLNRAGTVILTLTILLWFMSSYPHPRPGQTEPAINSSFAGHIGHWIEPVIKPLGFDWRIGVALIPGFAAREVMIGALATVYAVESGGKEGTSQALSEALRHQWSLPTALSLLVWYAFACQCLSTLAVTRRETNSWRWPAVMLGYMTVLAYGASYITYHLAMMGLSGQ